MKLGTRLLLPLLATVAGVMLVYTLWSVRQRERNLVAEARRETAAYATALGIALEMAYRDPARPGVQETIDRLSRSPTIYGVVVYEADGTVTYASAPVPSPVEAPAAALDSVLAGSGPVVLERTVGGVEVLSVVHALGDPAGRPVGAFEVAQPLDVVLASITRLRQRYLFNTLTLLAALTVVILWLVRRYLADPLQRLLESVRALGRGELAHRIHAADYTGELNTLAREFNRMAEHLERARAELLLEAERREALARRVRETEKMAAIGSVAAGVAHEIAAPLNVIRGRAELLLRRELPEADTRNARIITGQIERITGIVRDLLAYARRREPRPHPVELTALVNGVLDFVEAELRRVDAAVERPDPGECWVLGDAELLERVLLNLVMNAIHALQGAPPPRRLAVRIRAASEEGGDGPPMCAVEVQDTGPGVAPEDRDHIFSPYFTTRAGEGGTGLGLALARSIIEEHGGRIEIAEAAGGGALFRVHLPAARLEEDAHG